MQRCPRSKFQPGEIELCILTFEYLRFCFVLLVILMLLYRLDYDFEVTGAALIMCRAQILILTSFLDKGLLDYIEI